MVEPPDGTTTRTHDGQNVALTDRLPRPEARRPALRSTLVRDADAPDRRTLYPPGLTGMERMETWLSANERVFVDLVERR